MRSFHRRRWPSNYRQGGKAPELRFPPRWGAPARRLHSSGLPCGWRVAAPESEHMAFMGLQR